MRVLMRFPSSEPAAGRTGRARVGFEGGDLGALGAAPGLAGHQGGDEAEQAVGGEQQGRADPADARVQRGGDERGEAGDDGGELVGQRGAGGAGLGGEQLGEPGALHAGEGVLADRVADDEGDDDRERGARVDHEEQRHTPGDGERGAEQVDRAAADAVGERAPQDGGDDAERGGDHQRGQGGRAVGQLLARQVGQDEGDRHGVARGLGDAQAERAQHVAPVVAQHLEQRVLRDLALFLQLLELGRLLDLEPDEDADDDQHGAEQERHPPRPLVAQRHADQEREVGQQQPDREARLGDAGVEALLAPGRVLEAHEDRAAPLGAEREALDDADGDEQDPAQHADLLVGGQQPMSTVAMPMSSSEPTRTGLRPIRSPR